jgi:phosphoglucosamine mutase
VFEELGAEVIKIGVSPNGLNINEGVGATKPDKLREAVLAASADFGVALDGDGDRLIMVDHLGEIVDGDELIFIIARARLNAGQLRGPVIGTLMSNLGMEHALAELGVVLKRAAVGDRYVMEMMQQYESILGGEGSGHIICRDRTSTGDGIVAALQVMTEMWNSGKTLHDLKRGMEKYPQKLINVKIREKVNIDTIPSVAAAKAEVERELGDTGRVLLRSSGTEPLIRVMVEGREAAQVETLAKNLATAVSEALAA